MSEQELRALSAKVLGLVTADDAIVRVETEDYSHLRFAANAFQTSGRKENVNVTVVAWIGKRRAEASTNDLADAALEQTVEQAQTIARISPIDVEYLPTLGPQAYKASMGFSDNTANMSLADRARQIDEALVASEKASLVSAGFHQTSLSARVTATRHGNVDYQRSSLVSLSMTSRTPDGSSSGYFLRNHFDVSRLDTARIVREAIRRAVDARSARPLPPGRYPVILEPQAVADLIGSGVMSFNARSADEGRSAFSSPGGKTRLGEQVFDKRLNIISDPWRPELPASSSAQGGLPAQVVHIVRSGVLENLVYTRFWAERQKRQPTAGPVNTIIESSEPPSSVDEMIRTAKRALLVSRFWYIRQVDPRTATVTGLTRDGLWYIEDGKIRHPVSNFRFNQSLVQMLAPGNVEMIGGSERVGSSEFQGSNSVLLPPLRLAAFNFTSQSEAV